MVTLTAAEAKAIIQSVIDAGNAPGANKRAIMGRAHADPQFQAACRRAVEAARRNAAAAGRRKP